MKAGILSILGFLLLSISFASIYPGALYFQTITVNSSVSSAESNVTYTVSVNTSNPNFWNSTTCQNYVITRSNDNSTPVSSDIQPFNSSSCGNSSSNSTIVFNASLNSSTANTTYVLWLMPLTNSNATNPVLPYRASNLTGAFYPGETTSNPWVDHAAYANLSINGSIGNIITGGLYQYALSFGNSSNFTLYNNTVYPYFSGTGNGGFMALMKRIGNGIADGNGNIEAISLGKNDNATGGRELVLNNLNGASGWDCFTGNFASNNFNSPGALNYVGCQISANGVNDNAINNGSVVNTTGSVSQNQGTDSINIGRGNASRLIGFANFSLERLFLYNGTPSVNQLLLLGRTGNYTVNSLQSTTPPTIIQNETYNTTLYPTMALNYTVKVNSSVNTSIVIHYNLTKNGVTAVGPITVTIQNNTAYLINMSGNLTVGDNWSLFVQADDGIGNTSINNTPNTTVLDPITNAGFVNPEFMGINDNMNVSTINASGASDVSCTLTYNGTQYATTSKLISNQNVTFNQTVSLPVITAQTNVPGNWTCSFTSQYENLTEIKSFTTTVNQSGLIAPAQGGVPSINYQFFDGVTGQSVNVTFSVLFSETLPNGSIVNVSVSASNNSTTVNIAPSNLTVNTTAFESLSAPNYSAETVYHNYVANNNLQTVNLYIYQGTGASAPTILSVLQYPTVPVPNVQINIYKYTAPSNYTLFQSCTTQSDGTCLVFLIPNNVYYLFNFTALGTNQSFGPQTVICSPGNPTCYQNFILNQVNLPYYISGNFSGTCSFSNSTLILFCSGSDLGAIITIFSLSGNNQSGSQVCLNSSSGSSTTLTCKFPNVNGTYSFEFIGQDAQGNPYQLIGGIFQIGGQINNFGASGWLAMLLLFGIIAMAGSISMVLSIALGILALLVGAVLGFVPMGSIQQVIVVIGTMGGIIIWKVKQ